MLSMATSELRLELDSLEQLFQEPSFDPFTPGSRSLSGIDELLYQMRELSGRKQADVRRLVIALPAGAVEPGQSQEVKQALERYCAEMIEQNERELREVRRGGRRQLPYSLVIIFIGGALVYLISVISSTWSSELTTFLMGALSILAWVALWQPFQAFIYDWMPYRRDIAILEQLKSAEVVIEEASSRV
jgi:hypothetical protein